MEFSRRAQFIEGVNVSNRWLPLGNATFLRVSGLRSMQWSCYRKAEKSANGSKVILMNVISGGLQYMQTAGVVKVVEEALIANGVSAPPMAITVYRIAPLFIAFLPKRFQLIREHYSDIGLAAQVIAGAFLWRRGQRAYSAGVIFGAGITLASISTRIWTHYRVKSPHYTRYTRLVISVVSKGMVPVINHWETLSNWREDSVSAAGSAAKVVSKVAGSLLKSVIIKAGLAYASNSIIITF